LFICSHNIIKLKIFMISKKYNSMAIKIIKYKTR
jgi:hypothetical protein